MRNLPKTGPRILSEPLCPNQASLIRHNQRMFDTPFLYASLLWGTVGGGCILYGKKQGAAPALIAGFALLLASLIPSVLLMSAVSLLLLAGMVWGMRRGY